MTLDLNIFLKLLKHLLPAAILDHILITKFFEFTKVPKHLKFRTPSNTCSLFITSCCEFVLFMFVPTFSA
jgi:hypothetical protein